MGDENEILLQQVADHLIIQSSGLSDLGLYHGKMGIVLFFAHYARYTKNQIYDDFADELMDEIYEDIHSGIPLDFESGLAGIGWGILYLLKNEFVEGDPNEILEDIDQRIQEINLLRVKDLSLAHGVEGYIQYLRERIAIGNYPFDTEYMVNYHVAQSRISLVMPFNLFHLINTSPTMSLYDIPKENVGLQKGYAGYGLKQLLG